MELHHAEADDGRDAATNPFRIEFRSQHFVENALRRLRQAFTGNSQAKPVSQTRRQAQTETALSFADPMGNCRGCQFELFCRGGSGAPAGDGMQNRDVTHVEIWNSILRHSQ